MGADYLAYALIDLIVDNYFVELEKFGDQVESLEDEVVARPSPQTLRDVHRFKNDMIMLRKSLWPLREVIARLERRESPLISETSRLIISETSTTTPSLPSTRWRLTGTSCRGCWIFTSPP